MTADNNHPLSYVQKRNSTLCNYETEAEKFMGINLDMHAPVVQVQYTGMETERSFSYSEGKVYFSG